MNCNLIEVIQYEIIDTELLRQAHLQWEHIHSIGRARIQITKNGQEIEGLDTLF